MLGSTYKEEHGLGAIRVECGLIAVMALVSVFLSSASANWVYVLDLYHGETQADAHDQINDGLTLYVCPGDTVYFCGRLRYTYNPDHRDIIWSWDFRDGTSDEYSRPYNDNHEHNSHTYTEAGYYEPSVIGWVAGSPGNAHGDYAKITVECGCTLGEHHAGAQKEVSDLVGVNGTIKTRYGDLCCEESEYAPSTLQAAILGLWVYITEDDCNGWGEMGYLRKRDSSTNTARFTEVVYPGHYLRIDYSNAPSEGSDHTYKVELEKSTGVWKFYADETLCDTFADYASDWQNRTCSRASWGGEIKHKEDDMPGILSAKCNFTNCKYKKDGGSWQNAGLTAGDVDSYDYNEWGAEWISSTAFNIWDKNPGG